MQKYTVRLALGFMLVTCLVIPSAAAISLQPETDPQYLTPAGSIFKGTLVLTYPDGNVGIVEAGDAIPSIPSGSVLEIFDGHMRVATQEGDEASISILGYEFKIGNGAIVTAVASESEGLLIVHSGYAMIKDSKGEWIRIEAPATYPIKLGQVLTAQPTAETEVLGFTLEGDSNPDSTSIEAPAPPSPGSTTPSA